MLVGLTIHSLLDGVALAAAVTTATRYADPGAFVAIAPFLAILLHKPIDSLAIVSVMAAGGWSERARKLVGLCYALMVPIGALLFYGRDYRSEYGDATNRVFLQLEVYF